jgi:hypothetical protein
MLREICDIEDRERPHHPSQITRFLMNISPERLSGIIDGLVEKLWREASSMGGTVARRGYNSHCLRRWQHTGHRRRRGTLRGCRSSHR